MNQVPCLHVNVFPPEAGDLFIIYNVSKCYYSNQYRTYYNKCSSNIEATETQVYRSQGH